MVSLVRKYHKWLMAFVGIQFLFWSITGLYMVSVNIHYIHGETLAKDEAVKLDLSQVSFSFSELSARYPQASNITLTQTMGKPIYVFTGSDKQKLAVDAKSGEQLAFVNEARARKIAEYYYADDHQIDTIRLITKRADLPAELSPRHLPVWRVTFDGIATPTFYISQQTHAVVTKRHDFWRLFDWMWRFHIMDYDDGENVANWFLLLIASLGLLAAIAGAVLTYLRIFAAKQQVTR